MKTTFTLLLIFASYLIGVFVIVLGAIYKSSTFIIIGGGWLIILGLLIKRFLK